MCPRFECVEGLVMKIVHPAYEMKKVTVMKDELKKVEV